MSAAAVGRIVGRLMEFGWIMETERVSSGIGRRATMLEIRPNALLSVGVEIDRDLVRMGLVDLDGKIVAQWERRFEPPSETGAVADRIAEGVARLAKESRLSQGRFIGVGIGMPGMIRSAEGTVAFSAQLGWTNERFADLVERRLRMPVFLDNDLKAKALGESFAGTFANQGVAALVSIGSGVGAALVIDGNLYRGSDNMAGEIGHATIDPDGDLCECGKRGCLQTYLADREILRQASRFRPVSDIGEIFALMGAGEDWAIEIIRRVCSYVALTIQHVVCAYNPDVIILTGDLIEKHPEIFDIVSGRIKEWITKPYGDNLRLIRSALGANSAIVGAARLAFQQRMLRGEWQRDYSNGVDVHVD